MNAQEIIAYIAAAEKKTPVKVYVNETAPIDYGEATVFGEGRSKVVFGDWRQLGPILTANAGSIADLVVENDRRNSAIPLLDMKGVNAVLARRYHPGAGGDWRQRRHYDGCGDQHRRCHRRGHHDRHGGHPGGSGYRGQELPHRRRRRPGRGHRARQRHSRYRGGWRAGRGQRRGHRGRPCGQGRGDSRGAVVIEDVPENAVVAGCPARVIKMKDEGTTQKTALEAARRTYNANKRDKGVGRALLFPSLLPCVERSPCLPTGIPV